MITFYDGTNSAFLTVETDDSSYRSKQLMGENVLEIHYSMTSYLELPVGAWCDFEAERYTLESPADFTVHGDRNYAYKVVMYGAQSRLRRYRMRDTTIQNRLKFSYTATPRQHLSMIVANMNRHESGWAVGDCIEAAEQVISYNHASCAEALQDVAATFATEFEVINKTIHLRRVEYNQADPLPLRYGKGGGLLPGVGRENFSETMPCEILYVQGGSRNIDVLRYGSTDLLLPDGQTIGFDGNSFSDESGYNSSRARSYVAAADGLSIQRSDKPLTSYVENSVDLSAIYPSRVGTVSAVETEAGTDSDGNPVTFYDILDSSIPQDLNFADYQIGGETPTVKFQSGRLSGREFGVEYIHAERRFKIAPAVMDGQNMPASPVFIPSVGDRYAVFGCMLPDAYIRNDSDKSGASWDLFREAVRYKYVNEDQQFVFSGELDGIYAAENWIAIGGKLRVGGYVRFTSDKFIDGGYIDIRIVGMKTYLNTPKKPVLDLSNTASGGRSIMSNLREIGKNEVVREEGLFQFRQFTRRSFLNAKEAQDMLERALESLDFTPGIMPVWVRTMSVLIGNEFQQFEFVNSKTEPQYEVIPAFNMDNTTKVFTAPASILKHLTMGIENTSSSHPVTSFKYWDVSAYTSPFLSEASTPYFLVAKCDKTGTNGSFLLQENYSYDPGDGFYYFLVGLLSSEEGGERSFATSYGFTEILPGQMRIKMIISPDGKTYFNVAQGEIGGNIKILSGSSGYNNLIDKPDLGVFQTKAEFNVFANQISGTVTAHGTEINSLGQRVTTIESAGFITTAQGNTLWASKTLENGNTIASLINQTATTIQIQASKINLQGQVTFSMLDTNAQNTINGKMTGSVTGSGNSLAIALAGTTIVSGGYLQTSLIRVRRIEAVEGTIGGFIISGTFLGTGTGTDGLGMFDEFIKFRSSLYGTECLIGSNVLPSTAYGAATARFSNMNTDVFNPENRNVLITTGSNVNAANKNRHIHIECGDESGYGFYIRLEHRRFLSADPVTHRRTCIQLSRLPPRNSIDSLGAVTRRLVYWDENSGYLFWE